MKDLYGDFFCYDKPMIINATLCTTNGNEPWAANVDLEVLDGTFIVNLDINYTHYKNLMNNTNVMIVYRNATLEILIKGLATSIKQENDDATVTIKPIWLRLVETDNMDDISDPEQIKTVLVQKMTS